MKHWHTIVVDPVGSAQIKDLRPLHEEGRMQDVRDRGSVPRAVGDAIPEAPARGPVRMFDAATLIPNGEVPHGVEAGGFEGRKTLQRADVFDVMLQKARAAHGRAVSKAQKQGLPEEKWPVYEPPLTTGQIAMGRFYRDLTERHACAGVKCSSVEALAQSSGGSGGEYMDAVLRDRMRLNVLHRRIGQGIAKELRRFRPSEVGSRMTITDRRLVDAVCLGDQSLTEVLRANDWVREGQAAQAKHIKSLRISLAKALDRMMGPKPQSVFAAQYGDGCSGRLLMDMLDDLKKGC